MLILGLVVTLAGAVIAALLDRGIGVIVAVIGIVLMLVALLAGVDLRT